MKKLIYVLLSLVLAMSLLTACGGKKTDNIPETKESQKKTEQATKTTDKATEEVTEEATKEPETETPVIENNEHVVTEMENRFVEELDYIVPEEELEPSSMMTNAILKKTTVTVNAADKNWCDVTICYPNALEVLMEVAGALPEDADWDQIDEAYKQIAAIIESDEVEMLEEQFVLPVTYEYGYYDIVWSDEAINALRGGLYLVGME